MDKRENPIHIVEVGKNDFFKKEFKLGPKTVFGEGATQKLRESLALQTTDTLEYFDDDFNSFDGIAGIVKVTLREEALAKSHRPIALLADRSCPIVGTLDFGEILVSATRNGLNELRDRILTNQSNSQKANISAIKSIEPYSISDRLKGFDPEQLNNLVAGGGIVKARLFDHKNGVKNQLLRNALNEFAQRNEIELTDLHYGNSKGLIAVKSHQKNTADVLSHFIGLRSLTPIPQFQPVDIGVQMTPVGQADEELFPPPVVGQQYPVVGVIDSGVCPNNSLLSPWIVARESYVTLGNEDHAHGTMVAGLIVNSRALNHQDERFPNTQAKIVDVCVFPKDEMVSEEDMVAMIAEVVPKYPDVKIWNLSLGGGTVDKTEFSDFAHFLDELHDEYGCLFVVAAGNQNDKRQWPTNQTNAESNRISAPADSVRALTVGSVAHKTTPAALAKNEEISPFSRIGPGPCFIPKPEITHFGGNLTPSGSYAQIGVLSLGPNNTLLESVGTSFSTPIASSIAANLHYFFADGGGQDVPPERLKALMIHSALLGPSVVSSDTINYQGFGRPGDTIDHLYCDPNCITFMFEADVRHGGFEFERVPFPIADCLNTDDGKFKGEILMTLVYSPITDKDFASEYCRTNVNVGMGRHHADKTGKRSFNRVA